MGAMEPQIQGPELVKYHQMAFGIHLSFFLLRWFRGSQRLSVGDSLSQKTWQQKHVQWDYGPDGYRSVQVDFSRGFSFQQDDSTEGSVIWPTGFFCGYWYSIFRMRVSRCPNFKPENGLLCTLPVKVGSITFCFESGRFLRAPCQQFWMRSEMTWFKAIERSIYCTFLFFPIETG